MNKLRGYLKDVATLECQIYTQDILISQLQEKANKLGKRKRINKPVLETRYTSPDTFWILIDAAIAFIGMFAVMFLSIAILPDGFYKRGIGADIVDIWLYTALIRPFVYGYLLMYLPYKRHSIKSQKRYFQKQYEKSLVEYNKQVKQDIERVERELSVKQSLEEQICAVKNARRRTKDVLNALYSIGIIHEKYQDFVAVSSFYDYIDTGRCSELVGRGGAYDTYEFECYLGRIETKLDVIVSKLDQIIHNQIMISGLLREANGRLQRIERKNDIMIKNMTRIEENSELTEYNTRCAMQSGAIMENMMFYHTLLQ